LLPAAMVALELAEGRLVKLADVALLEEFAYYLVYPESSHERPKVAAFRAWILNCATGDAASPIAGRVPDLRLSTTDAPSQRARSTSARP
jgi:LysR family transcriptional regulator, glycine cleavage system transcriptional activator